MVLEEIDGHGDGLTARGTVVGACQWISDVMKSINLTAIQPTHEVVGSDEGGSEPGIVLRDAGDLAGDAGQAIDA